MHGTGAASDWAAAAAVGDVAAVSGPGRGYTIDPDAPGVPARGRRDRDPGHQPARCASSPTRRPSQVHIEVAHPDARLPLPDHPRATVTWWDLPDGARPGTRSSTQCAGESIEPGARGLGRGRGRRGATHPPVPVRRASGCPGPRTTVRGYWKHGRGGDADRRLSRADACGRRARLLSGVEPALTGYRARDGATGGKLDDGRHPRVGCSQCSERC